MLRLYTEIVSGNSVVKGVSIVRSAPGTVPSGVFYLPESALPVSMRTFMENYTKFRVNGSAIEQLASTTLSGRVVGSVDSSRPLALDRDNKVEMFLNL